MCPLARDVIGKVNSWNVPWLPTGTRFAWNEWQPAAFQPPGIPWGTTASSHNLNANLSLGQAQGKLERSPGRYSDEDQLHKAGTSAFLAGLCRWQTNADGPGGTEPDGTLEVKGLQMVEQVFPTSQP